MNCVKCGKEIPNGDKKICEECQKNLLLELDEEVSTEENDIVEKKESKNKKAKKHKDKSKIKEEVEKNNNVKKVLLLIILLVIVLVIFLIPKLALKDGISTFKFINNKVGNTIANIRNYGYTAEQGGIVYFVAPSKDGKQISIYKTDKSKVEPKELIKGEWEVYSLNVVKDYIFFIALTDDEVEKSATLSVEDSSNNKIYRMKTDGTDLQVINSNEFHDKCYEIYVIKDKIYYIGVDANIWRMNLDGSEKTKINNDRTGYLGLTEDYIILNIEKKQEKSEDVASSAAPVYETCIMNIDGTDKKVLNGERLYSINIVGDYIYYIDLNKSVYKIKIDGTDNVKISDDIQAYNMNIINNRIFYVDYVSNTEKTAIYSMNLDGSDKKEVIQLENIALFLNVINNKLIYLDSNKNGVSMNMIGLEGEDKEVLYEFNSQVISEEETHNENEVEQNANSIVETSESEENTEMIQ